MHGLSLRWNILEAGYPALWFVPDFFAKPKNLSVPAFLYEKFTVPSLMDFVDGDSQGMLLCFLEQHSVASVAWTSTFLIAIMFLSPLARSRIVSIGVHSLFGFVSVAQKIGLRKSFRIFGDHVLLRCFNSFILPCLEYCSPVWTSATDSLLKLLDKNLRACKFLIPNLTVSLQHRRFISSLCMLYKIFHNPSHPLHSELPNLLCPRRVTRGSLSINSLSFSPMRFHTSRYSRCFIPATTKLWNELPSMIVEAAELQKFKMSVNAFLLGVDGL